ncbi:hypothetical protein P3342_003043 [Pyrenophora teres f. teres]|nr:hypothetical protein P3342_003043 [Pyrenophora teres f. teres]
MQPATLREILTACVCALLFQVGQSFDNKESQSYHPLRVAHIFSATPHFHTNVPAVGQGESVGNSTTRLCRIPHTNMALFKDMATQGKHVPQTIIVCHIVGFWGYVKC